MAQVKQSGQAGIADKSDVLVTIEPREPGTGRHIVVRSPFRLEFGRHITETVEAVLNEQDIDDVAVLVEGGLITGASFGFQVPPGGDTWLDRGDGSMLRELRNVELAEVTVTATPAYADTEVAKRSRPHQQTHVDLNRAWLETVKC